MNASGESQGDALVVDAVGNIIASGITSGSDLEIQEDDSSTATGVTVLNFEGAINTLDEGSGKVTVTVSGISGSGIAGVDIEEAGTPKVTDATILNFVSGATITDAGGGQANITVSGGAGGGEPDFTLWMPDAAPNSPGAYDDEFDDSSYDSGLWTAYDEGADLNVTEDERGLILNSDGGQTIAGIYQDVPAGAGWSIIAKVASTGSQTYTVITGLLLLEDVDNLDTSNLAIWGQTIGGQRYGWAYYTANDYTQSGQAEANSDKDNPVSTFYFRIRAVGTDWYLDWSIDGLGWFQKATVSRPWTPTGFGIGKRLDDNIHPSIVSYFRYTTDTDYDDIMHGDRVDMWRAT
jgi:hypothetical protein